MAKKTRAERKKLKQRAQGTSSANLEASSQHEEASVVSEEGNSESSEGSKVENEEVMPSDEKGDDKSSTVEAEKPSKEKAKQSDADAAKRRKKAEKARKKAAKAEAKKNKPRRGPKFIWTFINYLRGVRTELKRVVWPTKREVGKMTVIVLLALVFFGVIIYVVDAVVTPLLYLFSGIGG